MKTSRPRRGGRPPRQIYRHIPLRSLIAPLAVVSALSSACAREVAAAPSAAVAGIELGKVHWRRDFEAARVEARKKRRPLLVLFTEIPGCSTVRGYGQRVLSHPLLVEAAESLFVPVAVFNNRAGADRRVLRSFGEPSWNNPVVRVIDAERRTLAPRLDGDYSVQGLARTLSTALGRAGRPVPRYLGLLVAETRPGRRRAVFAMGCFWSGEASLGAIDGVVATRAGFAGGQEVVELYFDPTRISHGLLSQRARATGARELPSSAPLRVAPVSDQLRHLRASPWRRVALTPLQRTRINAALAARRDAKIYASPRQRSAFAKASARRTAQH